MMGGYVGGTNYYTTNIENNSVEKYSKLIYLDNGGLVEVKVSKYEAKEISARQADMTFSDFSQVENALCKIATPVINSIKRLHDKDDAKVSAEIELGLSFEAEGNLYITHNKVDANLNVKLVIQDVGH